MLTENGSEKVEMQNNNSEELKINYSNSTNSDEYFKDNAATKENDVQEEENDEEAGQELSFACNAEPPQQESTPLAGGEQKRGRGRPKKSVDSLKLEKKEYSMAADNSSNMEESNELDTTPENDLNTSDEMCNQTAPLDFLKDENITDESMILNQSEPIAVKRGRGRPKKVKLSPEEMYLDTSDYRPRKPSFLPQSADQNQYSRPTSISEVKTRLRGRPKTNYLHVQKMWTPKTAIELAKKHRRHRKLFGESVIKIKGARGRPRIHPHPDPNRPKYPGRGRPKETYDPEHIKILLEKRYQKEKEKATPKLRGRPTKLESLKMMLVNRQHDSPTSTKCTTPNQSDYESDCNTVDESQLTFPLSKMILEVQGSRCGESIENKENLLFVSSKSLCDNRKLKEKILERTDPVFRDMKLKFKQELKNIQKLEVKNKPPQTSPYHTMRKRGPRGPYKKTLLKLMQNTAEVLDDPTRIPISNRLKEKREKAAARALEPIVPEPPPLKKFKKILPREEKPSDTPTCTLEPLYPSDLDAFMKANNLTYRRDPVPKVLHSKNPFLAEPTQQTLIVTKNPFRDPPKKRGRPRKYPLPDTQSPQKPAKSPKKNNSVCINLVSSDDEDEYDQMNYTYPMVANEPISDDGYDDMAFPTQQFVVTTVEEDHGNDVSISLISDDEDGQ